MRLTLLLIIVLVTSVHAEDRRSNPSQLSVMTINTYFMWDGVEPEEGSSQIDIPWRGSSVEAQEHMAKIADLIKRANPDIVNLVEIENVQALHTLNDLFLGGRGYVAYFAQGGDTFTGQDMGFLTRIDPDDGEIHYEERLGQSGTVKKSSSKNYYTTLTVGDAKIFIAGVHFLARPNQEDRRLQREAQADAIRSSIIENRCVDCQVIVLGDFNDYDGLDHHRDHIDSVPITNVLTILRGLNTNDLTDDLTNVARFVPKAERYTAFWDQDDDSQIDLPHELTSIDHILVSSGLAARISLVEIDHGVNPVLGMSDFATDHYPITVRFDFEQSPVGTADRVRIALLLPNPAGDEGQDEEATIANDGSQAIDMSGWTLVDRVGKTWILDDLGTIQPGEEATIQRLGQPMAMNNTGDTIDLVDTDGNLVDSVTYGYVAEGEYVISN